MQKLAHDIDVPSGEGVDTEDDAARGRHGPADAARLACIGEALAAARDYAGLDRRLSADTGGFFGHMNAAYEAISASGRSFTPGDFALYFLSRVHEHADTPDLRDALRRGAVRYLNERRDRLSPDFAALEADPLPDAPEAAAPTPLPVREDPAPAPPTARSAPAPGPRARAERPARRDPDEVMPDRFIEACEELKQHWRQSRHRRQNMPDGTDSNAPFGDPVSDDAEGFESLRAREREAADRLRADRARRRTTRVVAGLVILASLGLSAYLLLGA